MVTAEQVWDALAEVPDPEIPVVSLVDLGVVRGVRVEHDRVHVDFTPTFLGCPALEVMRNELSAAIAAQTTKHPASCKLQTHLSRPCGIGRR